jgi:predicted DCC family thiol-disulfide oxidoreductase YuxK
MAASMTDNGSLIIYDGDCIFCHNYVRLIRLRASLGNVELIDARGGDPRVRSYWSQGYDLNTGMLFIHGGKVYHGAEAIHVLGCLSSRVFWFNRLNRFVFSSRTASTLLYPILKLGRLMALLLRGRSLMTPPSLGIECNGPK